MKKSPVRDTLRVCVCAALLGVAWTAVCSAQEPIRTSQAFHQCLKKPRTEFAKIVCLLNFYRDSDFIIRFDGADYDPSFVHPYARIYLLANYHQETAVQWAKKYCYVSPFAGDIIYVKHPDGRHEMALKMILRDLEELEQALKGN